jgi:hypothetical protein
MKTRMKPDEPLPPETIRHLRRKNRLWLLIVPPLLSLALVSVVKPAGRSALAVELGIILLCSFLCGFALAVRSFKTARHRFWGGLFFSGNSLYLISCVVFLGCMTGGSLTPAEMEAMKHRQEAFSRQREVQAALIRQQEEVQDKARFAKQLAPRDADADASMLDLSAFYDGLLPGQDEQPASPLHILNSGTHTWNGIKFDARGMIQSCWNGRAETNSIPVGRKCSEIDFLHGTSGWMTSTNTISRFLIHFANGVNAAIPIVFGKDVAPSNLLLPGRPNPTLTNSVIWGEIVRQGRSFTNAPPMPISGLYIKRWSNPFPDVTVDTIDFEPAQTCSGAFLVAITIQPLAGEKP